MALLKLLALLRWKEQADVPKVVRTVKNEDGTTSQERQSDVQTAWVSLRPLLIFVTTASDVCQGYDMFHSTSQPCIIGLTDDIPVPASGKITRLPT